MLVILASQRLWKIWANARKKRLNLPMGNHFFLWYKMHLHKCKCISYHGKKWTLFSPLKKGHAPKKKCVSKIIKYLQKVEKSKVTSTTTRTRDKRQQQRRGKRKGQKSTINQCEKKWGPKEEKKDDNEDDYNNNNSHVDDEDAVAATTTKTMTTTTTTTKGGKKIKLLNYVGNCPQTDRQQQNSKNEVSRKATLKFWQPFGQTFVRFCILHVVPQSYIRTTKWNITRTMIHIKKQTMKGQTDSF